MSQSSPNPGHKELRASHTPDAIRERLAGGPDTSYLRDFVYGAIDGAVTTFAVVSGVAGAGLSPGVIVILGVANLVADGFSMAASNFLGTRADEQLRHRARRREAEHIVRVPDGEREEIRQIFAGQGFSGEQLEKVVDVITSDEQRWIDTMIKEEYGLALRGPDPARAATVTFIAFVVIGALPLLPFLPGVAGFSFVPAPFLTSSLLTVVAFFVVGGTKARFVGQPWWFAGLETLIVGGLAAILAYGVGALLGSVMGTASSALP